MPVLLSDLFNTEIDIRRKPAVQFDLLLAEELPLFKGRKVKESEIYRLLYLVNISSGEEKIRYMGLGCSYLRRTFRVDPGDLSASVKPWISIIYSLSHSI